MGPVWDCLESGIMAALTLEEMDVEIQQTLPYTNVSPLSTKLRGVETPRPSRGLELHNGCISQDPPCTISIRVNGPYLEYIEGR